MSEPKPIKKMGGAPRIIMLIAGALVLVGGGAAGGVFVARSGMLGIGGAPASAAAARSAPLEPASYYQIEQGFTANLKDSGAFVQASVAVSARDVKVTDAVKANEPAMRAVILAMLTDADPVLLSTTAGRGALLARIRDGLNAELAAKVGNGGIDKVYFTAFVLQ